MKNSIKIITLFAVVLILSSCAIQRSGCIEKQTNYRKAKKGMVKCSKIKPQKGNPDLYLFGWRLKIR